MKTFKGKETEYAGTGIRPGEALAALIIPLLFLVAAVVRFGLVFDANDDRFISGILSGAVTGTPSVHAVHIKYWIALPLTLLYRLSPSIPWWGGFLVTLMWISHSLLIIFALDWWHRYTGGSGERSRSDSVKRTLFAIIIAALIDLGIFGFAFHMATQVQYTSVAILLAATGYAVFILGRDRLSVTVLFAVLEFVSFCMRDKGMLLVQPMGIAVALGIMLARKNLKWSKVLSLAVVLGAVVLIGLSGRFLAGEMKPEWKEFREFNTMREELYDFKGIPSYSEIKDIAEQYDVSESEWNAFGDTYIADRGWDIEFDKAVMAYAKGLRGDGKFSLLPAEDRKGAYELLFLGFILCAVIVIRKKYLYFVPFAGLLFVHCVIWGYMSLRGRMLPRVNTPLILTESVLTIIMIAFVSRENAEPKKKLSGLLQGIALAGLATVFALAGAFAGVREYGYIDGTFKYEAQVVFGDTLTDIGEYCNSHSDKRFVMDLDCGIFFMGLPLEGRYNSHDNYRMTSGWFAATPEYAECFREYFAGADEFYLIVPEYENYSSLEKERIRFLAERAGAEPNQVDSFEISTGGRCLVYRFEGSLY